MTAATWRLLADAVLLLHLGVLLFVVGGLLAVLAGGVRGWAWVRHRGFRFAHLAAIGVVVLQSWLGQQCPLTTLESWLRVQAGAGGYAEGFIQHWVTQVLFYQAPGWVFGLAYTVFGAAVVWTWWWCPPGGLAHGRRGRQH